MFTPKKPILPTFALGVGWTTSLLYLGFVVLDIRDDAAVAASHWQFLVYMLFLGTLRFKISFDDAHYFRSRAKPTKYSSYGLSVGMITYFLWAGLPVLAAIKSDHAETYIIAILTIELSTIWIALTGLDVEEQKKYIAYSGESDAIVAFKQINRFYREQPWWIITNCFYIFFSGLILYFLQNQLWGGIAAIVLLVVLLVDWRISNPFRYLLGDDGDDDVTCPYVNSKTQQVCGAIIGRGKEIVNYCHACGTSCVDIAKNK